MDSLHVGIHFLDHLLHRFEPAAGQIPVVWIKVYDMTFLESICVFHQIVLDDLLGRNGFSWPETTALRSTTNK